MIPVVINDLRRKLEIEPENYQIYQPLEQVRDFQATKFAFDIECDRWTTMQLAMVGLIFEPL